MIICSPKIDKYRFIIFDKPYRKQDYVINFNLMLSKKIGLNDYK